VLAGAVEEEPPVLAGVLLEGVLLELPEQPARDPAQISAAIRMESVFFIVFVLS